MLLVQKRTVMPRRVLTPKVINVDTPLPSCEAQPSNCPLRPRVAKRFWMGDIFAHACRSPARGRPSCWGSEPKSRSLELGRLWSVALPGARRGHNASVTGRWRKWDQEVDVVEPQQGQRLFHPCGQGNRARSLVAWPSSSVRSASCRRACTEKESPS